MHSSPATQLTTRALLHAPCWIGFLFILAPTRLIANEIIHVSEDIVFTWVNLKYVPSTRDSMRCERRGKRKLRRKERKRHNWPLCKAKHHYFPSKSWRTCGMCTMNCLQCVRPVLYGMNWSWSKTNEKGFTHQSDFVLRTHHDDNGNDDDSLQSSRENGNINMSHCHNEVLETHHIRESVQMIHKNCVHAWVRSYHITHLGYCTRNLALTLYRITYFIWMCRHLFDGGNRAPKKSPRTQPPAHHV